MTHLRALIVAAGAGLSLAAGSAAAAELTLRVTGVAPNSGTVSVAVLPAKAADDFPASEAAVARLRHAATDEAIAVALPSLPAGDYAAVAYQDTNGNGELDTNLTGAPTEPVGYSAGAEGMMGPPEFSAAAVSVGEDGTATEIPLSN